MKQYTVALIGAGSRGQGYANRMAELPEKYRVVAVAEPILSRREAVRKRHGIAPEMCFSSWEELLAIPKIADLALICTMDEMHFAPAMRAIELGYDLLLEKPLSQTPEECAALAVAAKEKNVKVLVCHVLRYTPFFRKIRTLVAEGVIGKVQSVIHVEAVGNVHQSHSYVRGNWHSEKETTPMLLAKSCHDLDILQWILDKPCRKVQSFGSLSHFRSEDAPAGAPVRCIDGGCPSEETCPYNCKKLYLDDKENDWFRGAATRGFAEGEKPTDEEVLAALKGTDYGLCVYHANNDVVDHQVVNMEFDGGITVSFTMNAFNRGGRYIRLFGTKGEMWAYAADDAVQIYTFEDRVTRSVPVREADESINGGHGGGDDGIVRELYDYLGDDYQGFSAADVEISAKNHLIGFAAEEARHCGNVTDVNEYFARYGLKND